MNALAVAMSGLATWVFACCTAASAAAGDSLMTAVSLLMFSGSMLFMLRSLRVTP
jgi:hypothetical protein